MKSNLIDIAVELKHETDKAYLVTDGSKDAWLPKSQCEYADGIVTMEEWLAKDKGLI
jgi:N-acetylglucosamine-6-phosphate deacetylase